MNKLTSSIAAALIAAVAGNAAASQPHFSIDRINVNTGHGVETGNLLTTYSNGATELVSYMITDTGADRVRVLGAGSGSVSHIDFGVRFSLPGGGDHGGGGGGGIPPEVIQSLPETGDSELTVHPAVWILRGCIGTLAAVVGLSEFVCRGRGVQTVSHQICGIGGGLARMDVTCNPDSNQPGNPPPTPPGGGGPSVGGGGITFIGGFDTDIPTGTVTVRPLQPEENED